jgi:hypothetical protein
VYGKPARHAGSIDSGGRQLIVVKEAQLAFSLKKSWLLFSEDVFDHSV